MNNILTNPFTWGAVLIELVAWGFLIAVVLGTFGSAWHIIVGGVIFSAFVGFMGPVAVGYSYFAYAAFVKAVWQGINDQQPK